jgi:hypothetical protein
MKKSELIDGAEYEGAVVPNRVVVRGYLEPGYGNVGAFLVAAGHRMLVYLDSLRPVSSPPAIAEKDRLFSEGCCLCGGADILEVLDGGYTPENDGRKLCGRCFKGPIGNGYFRDCDAEVNRRKALAANTQPPTSPNRNARHCDKCTNPVVGGTLCKEHVESLGKPAPEKAEPKCIACNRDASAGSERCVYCAHRYTNHLRGKEMVLPGRLSDVDDRIAQAKRQLDAAYPGKYKYAETSGCFSTATWESD